MKARAQRKADTVGGLPSSSGRIHRSHHRSSDHPLLSLQRHLGNRAVLELLGSKSSHAEDSGVHTQEVPPAVSEVLASPGKPLEPSMRAEMEGRFGQDFSAVRVHTDSRAAASATMIDALAYTVGPRIVFNQGLYDPSSPAGKKLLAHELTHITQQRGHGVPGSGLKLGSPQATAEREAVARSHQVESSGPGVASRAGASVSPGTVQRSVAGGILGSVLGAIGGAVLGALVGGPVGAIVGGLGGLVAGAMIGEHATARRRRLTPDEISYAKEIYQDSVDYTKIEITRDSLYAAGAPRTLGNTIHLKSSWGHFKRDTMDLTDHGRETLIHEMAHVWQYQHGGLAYIPLSLIAQVRASIGSGTRNAAYDWRAAHRARLPWSEWNPEQQAQLVEDYNSALRRIQSGRGTGEDYRTVSIALSYIDRIRRGEGAPAIKSE